MTAGMLISSKAGEKMTQKSEDGHEHIFERFSGLMSALLKSLCNRSLRSGKTFIRGMQTLRNALSKSQVPCATLGFHGMFSSRKSCSQTWPKAFDIAMEPCTDLNHFFFKNCSGSPSATHARGCC